MSAIEAEPVFLLDACGTRRRLQALVAIGYPKAQLARRLRLGPVQFKTLLRRDKVTAATARAVQALYDDLWDQPPPGCGGAGAQVRGRAGLAAAACVG